MLLFVAAVLLSTCPVYAGNPTGAASSVSAAATNVSGSDTDANVHLFPFETVQLTGDVVDNLHTSGNANIVLIADRVGFGDTAEESDKQIGRAHV